MKFPDWREDKRVQRLHFWMGVRSLPTLPPIQFIREEIREEKPTAIQKKEIALYEELTKSSVKVNIHDLRASNNAPLLHEGKQVLAYIYEQVMRYGDAEALMYEGKSNYRFHITWCFKLQNMKEDGRIHRYWATRRLDGRAEVKPKEHSKRILEMELCGYCRKNLQAQGKYPTPFSFEKYFEKYDSWDVSHIPSNKTVVIQHEYTPDHAEISRRYREEAGWTCQGCSVNLAKKEHRRLLHLHHLNGVEGDNTHENLRVLCVDCHSQQDFHERMKTGFGQDIALVRQIRGEQGLRTPSPNESL